VPVASRLTKNPGVAVENPRTQSTTVSAASVNDARKYNQSMGYVGGPAYYG